MSSSFKARRNRVLMRGFKIVGQIITWPKPTLFTGAGSSLELCSVIGQMGTRKVLIVTDAGLVKIGLLDNIMKALTDNGVEFVVFDGVEPDPTYDQVEAGLEILKQHDCEAILAVGGGSPMDAAKIIAARATNDKPIEKMAGLFKIRHDCLPLYAIPTTAGTGSEVTVAAIVSEPSTNTKTPVMDPKLVPVMAALDASLMTGLPPAITAATGMDALTHAIEAYISINASEETDRYALAATKMVMTNLPVAYANGQDITARNNMALASCFAGLAFTEASLGYVHAIAHNFGAFYHTPHGLANSIVLPHILEFSKDSAVDRLADLAIASGLQAGEESDQELAEKLIEHIRSMMRTFEIPDKLDALRVEDIPAIAKAALKEAHYNYPVPEYMEQAQCEELLHGLLRA